MIVTVYIDFEDGSKLWKFHEWYTDQETLDKLTKFGFTSMTVNAPMYSNIRTSMRVKEGVTYLLVKKIIKNELMTDPIIITKYAS